MEGAARNGQRSTVNLLIDRGADIYDWRGQSNLALGVASSKGGLDLVRFLLQIEDSDKSVHDALDAALVAGQEEMVKLLLDHKPELRDRDSVNMAISCSVGGPTSLLPPKPKRYELPGDRSSRKSISEMTPTGSDCHEGLRTSLESFHGGFDWHKLTSQMEFHEVPKVKSKDARDEIAFRSVRGRLLRLAARHGLQSAITALLDHGFDIHNSGDSRGMYTNEPTAIEVAAASGLAETVKLLLYRGANVGRTLCFAVGNAQDHVIQLLLTEKPEIAVDSFVDEITLKDSYYAEERYQERSEASSLAIAVEWNYEALIPMLLE